MAKVPEMSADFARWYSEVFMDDGEARGLRWTGIVNVTTNRKISTKEIEILSRLVFAGNTPASGRKGEDFKDTYDNLVSTISGDDPTFCSSQNSRELQILAAVALSRLFKKLPDAAIAVTTSSFNGVRVPELPLDLLGIAEDSLVELSGRMHIRDDFEELKLLAPKVDFDFNLESDEALSEMDQIKTHIENLHQATTKAINSVVAGQNRVVERLQKRMQLDEEELQMLWWLLGKYSRHLKMPFSEIDNQMKPLALAYELGGMTMVSPGPASVQAMLSKANIGDEKIKLEDAVNSMEVSWAKEVSDSGFVSPVTTPIHYALEQRAELGAKDKWQDGWSALTGIQADVRLPSLKLAELFYREHLFLNVN